MIVHKYDTSVNEYEGVKDKNMSVKGALVKRLGPMKTREGMDTLLMAMSIVGRTFSSVVGSLGS